MSLLKSFVGANDRNALNLPKRKITSVGQSKAQATGRLGAQPQSQQGL